MRRGLAKTPILLFGLALAALLTGCGGGTKTVTVASTPLPEQTTSTPAPRTSTTRTTTTTTPTSTTTTPSESGGTSPSTTRTAPAPAFTHQGTGGTGSSGGTGAAAEGLSAAEAIVREKGFAVSAASDYHSNQTLRVLLGSRSGSAEGNGQQAFFFVDGRYIGTDAKQPSAQIHVVSQGDTEVALAYTLAGGAQATVRFQLNNGKLVPLDPIPSASARQ
jgi:hypothetical protein